MVFAPIRKYKYRKQLEKAGIPESSPSHNIAMDIALRFPGKIEDDLFLLDDLSYQNPDEFKQELEVKKVPGQKILPFSTYHFNIFNIYSVKY